MEIGTGTVAVVTGAASGIGLALANAFAAAGCSVVLADIDQSALDTGAAEVGAHGVETLTVVTGVSKADQVEALAAAIGRLVTDDQLCRRLSAAGPVQARRFSWRASADRLRAAYEVAIERHRAISA